MKTPRRDIWTPLAGYAAALTFVVGVFLASDSPDSDASDAKVIADAAERVEARYPALVGGIGVYKACCGHGPFTHIDTRGYRARWSGASGG